MGMFGDDDNGQIDSMAEEEIRQNEAELAMKRDKLFKTRLDIIKSQQEQWEK